MNRLLREEALLHHRLGYVPIWIAPQSKAPGMAGWSSFQPNEDSIRRHFSRFSNLGIRTGDVRADGSCLAALDLDVDDAVLFRVAEKAIGVKCPIKRGKKGATFIFRLDEELPSKKIHLYHGGQKRSVADFLCRGAQTVIPPSIHPETGQPYVWMTGASLSDFRYEELPLVSAKVLDEISGYCRKPDDPICALNEMRWFGVGGGGDTHDTCVAAVASMVGRGWHDDQIHNRIERAKREACDVAGDTYDWARSTKVIQGWIDSAREKGFGVNARSKTQKAIHGVLADEFLVAHGSTIRFDRDRAEWYVFDGVKWEPKQEHRVRHLIGQKFLPDPMRTKGVIDGVLSSLRDRPELSMKQDDWDPDRHLLNTPAGTVDLRTGEQRPHSAKDLITRCTQVAASPDADASFFLAKLTDWVGSAPEEMEYHQVLFGYFLSGETRDPCLAIWHGPGGDGKSKFAAILEWIMGDYAQTATETAFLETRSPQHTEEIACLRGARLVLSGEASGKWNESRIKSITGGDRLSGSFKFKPVFTFTPEFKPLITTNEPPRLISTGKDIARRLHVYPFPRTIANPDTKLAEKLQQIAGAILWWGIIGAVRYYKDGLLRSPVVEAANIEYLLEHDVLQQFLDEMTVSDPDARVRTKVVYDEVRTFFIERGHNAPSQTTLTRRFRAKGIECRTAQLERGKNPERAYFGIRLVSTFDEENCRF